MTTEYLGYAVSLILGAIVATYAAILAGRRRATPGALALTVAIAGVAVWAGTYAVHWLSAEPGARLFWLDTTYLGVVTAPVALFAFALQFTGIVKQMTPRLVALLAVEPLLTLAILWTDRWHHLFYGGPRSVSTSSILAGGLWFWIDVLFLYGLLLAALVLLFRVYRRSAPPRRQQAGVMLIALLLPIGANAIGLLKVSPFPNLDLTPFFFLISTSVMAYAFLHFRLLDVVPIARDALVETMSDGVLVLDTQDRVVDANPAALQILGVDGPPPIGRPVDSLLSRLPAAIEHLRETRDGRIEIQTDARTPRFADMTVSSLFDHRRRFSGRLVILHDITDHRREQAELERAKETAEAASRAKSTFLANISHELRTPLNSVLGFTELMADDPDVTPAQARTLAIIGRSGEHLLRLIDDVLEMSKIESGQLTLGPRPFDLRLMLDDTAHMLLPRAAAKGLLLTTEIGDQVPRYVNADEGKLRQVLVNLLGNAVKFTEVGEVRFSADAWLDEDVTHLRCLVQDTGSGIAPADQERLFHPFVQVSDTETLTEGTGLGLSISRDLARLMGGDITLASSGVPGEGSRFELDIPIQSIDEPPLPVREDALEPTSPGIRLAVGTPSYRLLVVDDDASNRLLMVTLLAQLGFDVREASDGSEARALCLEWQPHMVWMDLRMPRMTGFDALAEIRSLPGGAHLPVIALTASAFAEQRQLVLEAGFDGFLRKPVRRAEVIEELRRQLDVVFEMSASVAPTGCMTGSAIEQGGVIPPGWRTELRQAAQEADWPAVAHLVEEVRATAPELATALDRHLERFDYARLLEAAEAHRV